MALTQDPFHNVKHVEITSYEDQTEIDIFIGDDVFRVSVDSVDFADPKKVMHGCYRDLDMRVEYDSAMCTIIESDGHRQLHCEEWG